MSSIIISKAGIKELEIIQKTGRETFYETFAQHNAEEEMQNYLNKSFASEKLTAEINNPDSHFLLPGKKMYRLVI